MLLPEGTTAGASGTQDKLVMLPSSTAGWQFALIAAASPVFSQLSVKPVRFTPELINEGIPLKLAETLELLGGSGSSGSSGSIGSGIPEFSRMLSMASSFKLKATFGAVVRSKMASLKSSSVSVEKLPFISRSSTKPEIIAARSSKALVTSNCEMIANTVPYWPAASSDATTKLRSVGTVSVILLVKPNTA